MQQFDDEVLLVHGATGDLHATLAHQPPKAADEFSGGDCLVIQLHRHIEEHAGSVEGGRDLGLAILAPPRRHLDVVDGDEEVPVVTGPSCRQGNVEVVWEVHHVTEDEGNLAVGLSLHGVGEGRTGEQGADSGELSRSCKSSEKHHVSNALDLSRYVEEFEREIILA